MGVDEIGNDNPTTNVVLPGTLPTPDDEDYTASQRVKIHPSSTPTPSNTPLTDAQAEEFTRQWEERHRLKKKKK